MTNTSEPDPRARDVDPEPLMICTLQLEPEAPPEMVCAVGERLVHMVQTLRGDWRAVSLHKPPPLPLFHVSGSVTTARVALAHFVYATEAQTGLARQEPTAWLERIVESAERILHHRGKNWEAADAEDIVESIFGPEAAVIALAEFATWLPANGYRVPFSFGSDLRRWLAWFQFRSEPVS